MFRLCSESQGDAARRSCTCTGGACETLILHTWNIWLTSLAALTTCLYHMYVFLSSIWGFIIMPGRRPTIQQMDAASRRRRGRRTLALLGGKSQNENDTMFGDRLCSNWEGYFCLSLHQRGMPNQHIHPAFTTSTHQTIIAVPLFVARMAGLCCGPLGCAVGFHQLALHKTQVKSRCTPLSLVVRCSASEPGAMSVLGGAAPRLVFATAANLEHNQVRRITLYVFMRK